MTLVNPPLLASWLLELTNTDAWRAAVAGDLFEEYQRRRSPAWFWKQVAFVVGNALMKDVRQHWAQSLRALLVLFITFHGCELLLSHIRYSEGPLTKAAIPGLLAFGFAKSFVAAASGGMAVALTNRKFRATMVLFCAVFFACNFIWQDVRWWWRYPPMFFGLEHLSAVIMLTGFLGGGFLGCACFCRPRRAAHWCV